jgi:beta-lactamase class A
MNLSPLRYFLLSASVLLFFTGSCKLSSATTQTIISTSVQKQLATLEASSGGYLGVAAMNTVNNNRIDYHAEEHFPFCSTNYFYES